MRYCIGCTVIKDDGRLSFPYILTYNGNKLEFTPFLIQHCKGKTLMVTKNISAGKKGLINVKELNLLGKNKKCNYFLIKVDSLNFPFKVMNYIHNMQRVGKDVWTGYKILNCK